MRSSRIVTAAALLVGAALTLQALGAQAPATPAQSPPPAVPGPADPQRPGQGAPVAQGRGGGRGNPTATLFTDICSGCHGTGLEGGRSPSLFDDTWTHARDDESMAAIIANGIPNTEMAPFNSALTEQQIWQLVAYLRMQAGNLKEKPQYVADPHGQVLTTEKQTFKIDIIARNLETPWGLAFLPDGRLLITERAGRLRIVEKGALLPEPVKGTPAVWAKQDGGLLDVEVHPQYAKNGWIYLAYSETLPGYTPPRAAPVDQAPPPASAPQGGGGRGGPPDPPSMTVIVRGKIDKNNAWTEQQVLFRAAPELYSSTNAHYGSRFIFDKQGHLFYTLGDKNDMSPAQDLSSPLGKIHRVHDDGSVPKDNPFVTRAGAVPTIWSYGHRHPQGLSWNPVDGKLWESEHGPQGGDEINIIDPGRNYGWGVITMGIQAGITKRAEPGMEQPVAYFTPTLAPAGIAFYEGSHYPGWKNNLFVSGLAGQQLRRLEVAGGKVTHQEVLFNQFGRIRDAVVGPDGYLYVTMQQPGQSLSQSTPGMVARLLPAQ